MDSTGQGSQVQRFRKEYILREEDFYPPEDTRVLRSYIHDINGGDNFADYAKYIFKLYEQEDYYEL